MDPQAKDVETYIEFARAKGMEIKYVVDTHIQADHLSGGMRLAQLTGADYCLHQSAPTWRASAVGVYRLWRDLGYAIGALLAGVIADLFGLAWAIAVVAILTFVSGVVAAVRMSEQSKESNLDRSQYHLR